MTKEQFAELLNGRQYREELTSKEEQLARENNLVAAFGQSDDLLELRGAIDDEFGAYGGTNLYLFRKKGEWAAMDEEAWDERNETLETLWIEKQTATFRIQALWNSRVNDNNYSWEINATVPAAHFDVMEDEYFYCRGIVFSLNDL